MSEEKKTVLVVDDEGINRSLLAKIFGDEYNVMTAGDGLAALDILRQNHEVAAVILDIVMPRLDGYGVMAEMQKDAVLADIPVVVVTAADDDDNVIKALEAGAYDVITKPFSAKIILHRVGTLLRRVNDRLISEQNRIYKKMLKKAEIDEKTGIYTKHAFCRHATELLRENPDEKYVLFRWDVDSFKRYNDLYGTAAGDELLAQVGSYYVKHAAEEKDLILYGHWDADHFVTLRRASDFDPHIVTEKIRSELLKGCTSYEFTPRAGIYIIDDPTLDVALMCDRAYFALRSNKDKYTEYYAYYDESMRASFLEEHELVSQMESALSSGQFIVYYQPQYNYDNGALIGAEALVRWDHPTKGLIPPGKFIPLFERNGFITHLDINVWEQVCIALRKWIDAGLKVVPVSVNISRRDIYYPRLCSVIFRLISKYRLSPSMLKLEITESAYVENADQLISVVKELQSMGFTVEMDDFGSGYSSLNTLKDVPINILKLDVRFLSASEDNSKGGNILSSVLRMSHWLKLPVIAEGVETKKDADYLNSINCLYMQGYYFARPMPIGEFEAILKKSTAGEMENYKNVDLEGVAAFWDSSSQNALIFNSFVGGAVIVEYAGSVVELKRANNRFFKEIGATREEYLQNTDNLLLRFEKTNQMLFINMLNEAVRTGEETECEVQSLPHRKKSRPFWTHMRAKLLAKNGGSSLIYISVENVTSRRDLENERAAEAERNRAFMESTGVLLFDYDPDTDTMKSYSRNSGGTLMPLTQENYLKEILSDTMIYHTDRKKVRDGSLFTLKSSTYTAVEYLSKRFNNNYSLCRLELVSSADADGRVCHVAGTLKEVLRERQQMVFAEKIAEKAGISDDGGKYERNAAEQALYVLSKADDPEKAISLILEALGEALDVSRVYIIENDEGGLSFTNTFEWCAEGVEPEIDFLRNLEYPDEFKHGKYYELFDESGIISSPDVKLLPKSIYDILEPQGIAAIIHCALLDNGVFKGYLGFDECRGVREWSSGDIRILTSVSRLVGVFLFKSRRDGGKKA